MTAHFVQEGEHWWCAYCDQEYTGRDANERGDRHYRTVHAEALARSGVLNPVAARVPEAVSVKTQVRFNAERDPDYRPYCLLCQGLMRMRLVEPFLWDCECGAIHDERSPAPPLGEAEKALAGIVGLMEVFETAAYRFGVEMERSGDGDEVSVAAVEAEARRTGARHALANAIQAALRSSPADTEGETLKDGEATGWLIEYANTPGPPFWWDGSNGHGKSCGWTEDHSKAIRFARREDAQRVIKGKPLRFHGGFDPMMEFAKPSEHMWLARPSVSGAQGVGA